MDDAALESTFASAERALHDGRTPDMRAFWRAVARVKRDADLRFRYAERVSRIDRAVFVRRVPLRTNAAAGIVVLALGMAVGMFLLGAAASFEHPLRELIVLAGIGAILGTTHDLAHFIVGAALGIRFTDFFIVPPKPQPGLKIDYASYLRAAAGRRAWMHASGAIASKIVPFAVIPYALAIRCDTWAIWILAAVGIASLLFDIVLSVRLSDWKRFRREMAFARGDRAT